MIHPDKPSDVTPRNDLKYWVRRCCDTSNKAVFYLTYQGMGLRLHPARGAYLKHNGTQKLIQHDPKRHKGRGWQQNLIDDIEEAYKALIGGRGDPIELYFGDVIREEVARRESGDKRLEGERESWVEWLTDDELPLVMGSWCYYSGLVHGEFHISRVPKVDYYMTDEEFDQAAKLSHSNLFITLKRLAVERMKRANALKKS